MQRFNYSGYESKMQLTVYDSDTPVTLKKGQGHQTWYELIDPKHGYNNAKFEKSCLNRICEKANDKVFVKSGNLSIISLEYVWNSEIVVYSWPAWYTSQFYKIWT